MYVKTTKETPMPNPVEIPGPNEELLAERTELFALIERCQQQIQLANQRIAFLHGVFTARGVDPSAVEEAIAAQAAQDAILAQEIEAAAQASHEPIDASSEAND